MKLEHTSRMKIALVAMEICFLILIGRLFIIQLVHGEGLRARSESQRYAQLPPDAKRGKIMDRHHNVLAINRDLISVYADPKIIRIQPQKLAQRLAPALGKPQNEIVSILQQSQRRFVWLQRNLDYEHIQDIQEAIKGVRGLGYRIHGKRFYPKNTLACQVLGYTNYANEGVDGVELGLDTYLRGVPVLDASPEMDEKPVITDGKRRLISPPELYEEASEVGFNVHLTLDEYVQHVAEAELALGCQEWHAKRGTAIVMRSKSGEILAMANYPSYDLNAYGSSSEDAKRNLAIWMQFEPGSIFKIVTASAVINEKLMTPDSRIYCEMGRYRLSSRHTVHDVKPNGWLTLSEVIQKSSNIGILKAASPLGQSGLADYTQRFGFGQITGIELPFEQPGNLRGIREWDRYSLATVPFGQGISVTPIQALCAINVIATKGVLLQPYVIYRIADAEGDTLKQSHPKPVRRAISAETAREMTEMLVQVTEAGGGTNGRVKGYRVAGKTGTAQKAIPGQGYVRGKEITTFAGFLPAEDPQVSIIIVVDEPVGARFSNQVAAPIFQRIADQTMRYLNQQAWTERSERLEFTQNALDDVINAIEVN